MPFFPLDDLGKSRPAQCMGGSDYISLARIKRKNVYIGVVMQTLQQNYFIML